MKLAMVFALAGTLALTACGGNATPAPTVTVTHTATATPSPTHTETSSSGKSRAGKGSMTDEEFGDFIREARPFLEKVPTDKLVANAESTCNMFDRGETVEDVMKLTMEYFPDGEGLKAMGFLMGAGVRIYCPEHAPKLEG
jgi:hypothetical protein